MILKSLETTIFRMIKNLLVLCEKFFKGNWKLIGLWVCWMKEDPNKRLNWMRLDWLSFETLLKVISLSFKVECHKIGHFDTPSSPNSKKKLLEKFFENRSPYCFRHIRASRRLIYRWHLKPKGPFEFIWIWMASCSSFIAFDL